MSKVWALTCKGLGFNVQGLGFNVQGLGFNVQGLGIDPLQVAQDIQNNPADLSALLSFINQINTAPTYNSEEVAVILVDNEEHGQQVAQVYNEFNNAIANLFGASKVRLVRVVIGDGDNYDADTITQEIQQAVQDLEDNYGITDFVINLSFGLIPCEDPDSGFNLDEAIEKINDVNSFDPIVPIVERVCLNLDGTYTAHFGYFNPNAGSITIPPGPDNSFTLVATLAIKNGMLSLRSISHARMWWMGCQNARTSSQIVPSK